MFPGLLLIRNRVARLIGIVEKYSCQLVAQLRTATHEGEEGSVVIDSRRRRVQERFRGNSEGKSVDVECEREWNVRQGVARDSILRIYRQGGRLPGGRGLLNYLPSCLSVR